MSFAAFLFVLSGWLWAHFALRGAANAPLILHFDDLSGITSVGTSANLTFMGFFGIAIVIMNFFIAIGLEDRDRFFGKLAAAATLVFAILLFIAFAAILNVN